ncbi:RusA family crossover junction endodeoxyribonuclease [Ethanoligenens sp.]|uniref:RusA family crossover junction endodeoxyribonuclease n=1 Tax=Ethanoligenens sp. TaxID=2099655 RepID=UPI0039E9D49E
MTDSRNAEHYHDPTAAQAMQNCNRHFAIVISGKMPDLNDMIKLAKSGRGKYQPYAREKVRWTQEIAWECKRMHIPQLRRASVKIDWREPDARRDPDNIAAAAKYIMDGLVVAGVIRDDSQRYVTSISHVWHVDKQNPRVVVEIEEG